MFPEMLEEDLEIPSTQLDLSSPQLSRGWLRPPRCSSMLWLSQNDATLASRANLELLKLLNDEDQVRQYARMS